MMFVSVRESFLGTTATLFNPSSRLNEMQTQVVRTAPLLKKNSSTAMMGFTRLSSNNNNNNNNNRKKRKKVPIINWSRVWLFSITSIIILHTEKTYSHYSHSMASEDINNLANQFDYALVDSSDDNREVVNVAQNLCLRGKSNSIIGKFITSENMSRSSAERYAKLLWRNKIGNFELRKKNKNLFTVKFETKDDWRWVLSEAPWCLDGFLWIIKPWNPTLNYKDISFDTQQFWVIFKDLPQEFLNVFVVNEMGKILGNMIELDPEDANPVETNDVDELIELDIAKSLTRGVLSQNVADCTLWIPFYYQKHPHQLCPSCFIIDHDNDDCKNKAKDVRDLSQKLFRFIDKIIYNMKTNAFWIINEAPTRISPKKNNKSRRANMVLFVRPEDGQYCNSLYSEKAQEEDNSTTFSTCERGQRSRRGGIRRFKRTRDAESSRTRSNNMIEPIEEEEEHEHQTGNAQQLSTHGVRDWDKHIVNYHGSET